MKISEITFPWAMDSEIGLTLYSKTNFIGLPSRSKSKPASSGHSAIRTPAHARPAGMPSRGLSEQRWGVKTQSLCARNVPGKAFFKLAGWGGRERKSEGERHVCS